MPRPIKNMRIQFYGVQGSYSSFPTGRESEALQDLLDFELLKRVFQYLKRHMVKDKELDGTLNDLIGGPIDRPTLISFKKKLTVPKVRIYGGWTTCVRVETADGYDIVLDSGSGFRACALDLQNAWGGRNERHLHLFGSHSHYDHIEGFDQAAVCFDPRNILHVYGNGRFLYALDHSLGIFSNQVSDDVLGVYTPFNYEKMPARFLATEIRDPRFSAASNKTDKMTKDVRDLDRPVILGETQVTAFKVYHPAPCLAYKIQHGGKTFVYCTDHELRRGGDPGDPRQKESLECEERLMRHADKADVLYRDAQYLRSDYDGQSGIGPTGPASRLDWGHSCIEDVQEMALKCGAKNTFIGHHDPNREWSELNWIDESLIRNCERLDKKISLARAGLVVDL